MQVLKINSAHQEIPESINISDIQLMTHLLEIRVLDHQLRQHRLIVNFDGNSTLISDGRIGTTIEEFNVGIISPLKEMYGNNMIGLKSTAYGLKNGIYQKIMDFNPEILKPKA